MRPRLTLPVKILLLAIANIALIAGIAIIVLNAHYGLDWTSFLTRASEDRLLAMGRALALDLQQSKTADARDALVERYSNDYRLQLHLFRNNGQQLAGPKVTLPEPVLAELHGRPGLAGDPPPPPGLGRPEFGDRPPPRNPPGRRPMLHVQDWLGVRIPIPDDTTGTPLPGTLMMKTSALAGSTIFVDLRPWLWGLAGALAVTLICWAPFLRNLTRSIQHLTRATGQIAEGRFSVDLTESRRDELGQLSIEIRRMSDRLATYVHGQKRFLGDVAHELCSPIARLQFAIGILEQKAGTAALTDIRDEVEQISALVEEILQFSRASLHSGQRKLEEVPVFEVVWQAVSREGAEVELAVPRDLRVQADASFLQRALANLIRNAVRYAGADGPILVTAVESAAGDVRIAVADHGPGLPEDELERVFAPFYRPETARTREGGGFGLGLAIVKTCIEACEGTVHCRNRAPRGLEVEIRLRKS